LLKLTTFSVRIRDYHKEKVSTSHLLFHFQNKLKRMRIYKLLVVIIRQTQ